MKKRTAKTTIKVVTKVIAIAMIALGIHLMIAHFNKVLPFGIVSNNIGIWFVWAYTGWLIGAGVLTAGLMKLFDGTIARWLEKLEN